MMAYNNNNIAREGLLLLPYTALLHAVSTIMIYGANLVNMSWSLDDEGIYDSSHL